MTRRPTIHRAPSKPVLGLFGMVIAAAVLAVLVAAGGSASATAPEPPTTDVAPEPASDEAEPVTVPTSEPAESVPPDDGVGDEATDDETTDDLGVLRVSGQPTVRTTEIAPASVGLALAVLVGVLLAARRSTGTTAPESRRAATDAEVTPAEPTESPVDVITLRFLLELGEALVDAGDAVHNVAGTLQGVARVNGVEGFGAIVLPTALVMSMPGGATQATEVTVPGRSRLRLDQIDAVMDVVGRAERSELTPADGIRELHEIRARRHPWSGGVQLIGSAVAAAGLALVLRGGFAEVALASMLGAAVGAMNLATASARFLYRPFWPLVASFSVAVATFTGLRLLDIVAFPALVAPLIVFLPGALLTIGVLELATGQILAGSSRLASGVFQLVLLAIGIVAGAQLVGVPASAVGTAPEGPVAVAGPWLGVAVFGLGITWSQGLRRRTAPWILLVLYVAYAGQVLGGVLVGSALSSFFGAVAMTPVALLLARRGLGPAPLVTFFPGFWILVPGALGLEGVTRIISDDRFAAGDALITSLVSMIGISLGVLLGLAMAALDPERPWATRRTSAVPERRRGRPEPVAGR